MPQTKANALSLIASAVVGGLIVAGIGAWYIGSSTEKNPAIEPRQTPIIASGESFVCTPTRVWDGDGPIWCSEGPRVRLAGIAARELRQNGDNIVDAGCNEGHPCPSVDGVQSRDHLISLIGVPIGDAPTGHVLVRGTPLRCQSAGAARGSRTAAWCSNARGDLSAAMIRDGYALEWRRYARRRRRP